MLNMELVRTNITIMAMVVLLLLVILRLSRNIWTNIFLHYYK